MNKEEIIGIILENEKGFSKNEVDKIRSGFDQIYMDEKIKEHLNKSRTQKLTIIAMLVFCTIASTLLIAKDYLGGSVVILLQGLLIGLYIVIVVFFHYLFKNHSRIAMLLKILRQIMVNSR